MNTSISIYRQTCTCVSSHKNNLSTPKDKRNAKDLLARANTCKRAHTHINYAAHRVFFLAFSLALSLTHFPLSECQMQRASSLTRSNQASHLNTQATLTRTHTNTQTCNHAIAHNHTHTVTFSHTRSHARNPPPILYEHLHTTCVRR